MDVLAFLAVAVDIADLGVLENRSVVLRCRFGLGVEPQATDIFMTGSSLLCCRLRREFGEIIAKP
jgi:hypothetical protein